MNSRKHEKFKEPKLPKAFAFLMVVAFIAFIVFILFKALNEMKPEETSTEHFHTSKPEIFY